MLSVKYIRLSRYLSFVFIPIMYHKIIAFVKSELAPDVTVYGWYILQNLGKSVIVGFKLKADTVRLASNVPCVSINSSSDKLELISPALNIQKNLLVSPRLELKV